MYIANELILSILEFVPNDELWQSYNIITKCLRLDNRFIDDDDIIRLTEFRSGISTIKYFENDMPKIMKPKEIYRDSYILSDDKTMVLLNNKKYTIYQFFQKIISNRSEIMDRTSKILELMENGCVINQKCVDSIWDYITRTNASILYIIIYLLKKGYFPLKNDMKKYTHRSISNNAVDLLNIINEYGFLPKIHINDNDGYSINNTYYSYDDKLRYDTYQLLHTIRTIDNKFSEMYS